MIRFIATWEHFETKLNITILKDPGTQTKKRKKKKKTLGNNKQTLYIKALRAFILSYLIVCIFGRRRRFISDLKSVFNSV